MYIVLVVIGCDCTYILNCLCDLQFELRLRVENAIVLIKMTAIVRVKLLHSAFHVTSVSDGL